MKGVATTTAVRPSVDRAASGPGGALRRGSYRAQRNPILLFSLSGLLLLRKATRRLFVLLLFQEPPRKTRFVVTLHPIAA